MADRVLTWFVRGVLANNSVGTNVGEEYVLDADYVPERVVLRSSTGVGTITIDINDDGETIFNGVNPSVGQGLREALWDVFLETQPYLLKDSIITLDVDSVSSSVAGANLTINLELNRA